MKCPYCTYYDSKVIDSRSVSDGVRRRRQCLNCEARFTTYERLETTGLYVIKKDGRREDFSREKLLSGIKKACTKRPISDAEIETLVTKVEEELHRLGTIEVRSSRIGSLAMLYLKELDRVAYIRFASVYRAFADLDSFKEEVDALEDSYGRVSAAQLPLIVYEGFPNRPETEASAKSIRRGNVGR